MDVARQATRIRTTGLSMLKTSRDGTRGSVPLWCSNQVSPDVRAALALISIRKRFEMRGLEQSEKARHQIQLLSTSFAGNL